MILRYHTPLTPEEQRAHGLGDPQSLAIADKVRFSELDSNNHVNNKSYMTWFETVRVRHFDEICLPCYGDQPKPRLLVRSFNLRFVKEMLRNEDYITTAHVTGFRNTSYSLRQEIWAGDLRAYMDAIMVMQRPDRSGDRYPLPPALTAKFVELGAVAGE